MAELVASIKALGILQPPSVRKNDTGYEVIFGNRRVMATKELEIDKIMCNLKDMTDHEVFTAATTENMVRLPMGPMDQFEAFKKMADDGQSTIEIAATFGIPEIIVKRRMVLANLHPTVKKAFEKGDLDFDALSAFTTATPKQQANMFKDGLSTSWMIERALKQGRASMANAWFDPSKYDGQIVIDLFDHDDETVGYATDLNKFFELQKKAVGNQVSTDIKDGWLFSTIVETTSYDTKAIQDRKVERRYIQTSQVAKKDRKNYGITYFIDPMTCEVETSCGWQYLPEKKKAKGKNEKGETVEVKTGHTMRQNAMLAGAAQMLFQDNAGIYDGLKVFLFHNSSENDRKKIMKGEPDDLINMFLHRTLGYTSRVHPDIYLDAVAKSHKWNLRESWTPDEEFLTPYNKDQLVAIAVEIGANLDGCPKKIDKVKSIAKCFKADEKKAHAWMPFSE